MSAVAAWPAERRRRWPDGAYWEQRIDRVIAMADAGECNRCITVAHEELARALHAVTGPGSGANFHTWAVWGSRKAGATIRREEVPWVRALTGGASATAGAAAAKLTGRASRAGLLASACAGAAAGHAYATSVLRRASARILAGNITVLDDIGRQTGRFVSSFWDTSERTESKLERFVAPLRAGSGADGGQDLLRTAYASYLRAATAGESDPRDELMLLGNLNAILHEHYRLDRFIGQSLPRFVRGIVTQDLLDVTIGSENLRIGRDVPLSRVAYPATLRTIENSTLETFLAGPAGWDRTPNSTQGSGARDWTDIRDRMNFIVDLFRTRHHDPQVFAPPFDERERDRILALDGL